jgi:serine/threonine protein kinase
MIGMTFGSLHILGVVNSSTFPEENERMVYKAFDSRTRLWYALKSFNKAWSEPPGRQYENFLSAHYKASTHPNIISLLKVIVFNDYFYTVMPFYPEGDLHDSITQSKRIFDDDSIRSVFLQLLDAVEHCHHLGIYHLDLKPEHILVSGNQILLAGFTVSRTEETAGYLGSVYYASPGTY